VANAVKDLAGRVEVSSKTIMGTLAQLDQRIEAFAAELRVAPDGQAVKPGGIHETFATVEADVSRINAAAQDSRGTCGRLNERALVLSQEMQSAIIGLESATAASDRFLGMSEQMIDELAGCGVETPDTPYIRAAQEAAHEIAGLIEQAVAAGQASLDDVFDRQYQPIVGTRPAQFLARYNRLADQRFPEVQERLLKLSDKVVFCIAVDDRGYVSTHNKRYCQPQRGDLTWDTANSRYRRIFDDRTGIASARSRRPFLLQTYRRDMGGGQYVLLKEASAPIVVQGRHWGGLRLAYKF
jgi:methyl-accepting chemotaxis protein